MSDELKAWCDKNGFDVAKFTKLDLTLQKIAATKSTQIIIMAEQLQMTSTDERSALMNAVLALKQQDKDDNNDNDDDDDDDDDYSDDDEMIVHDDDDDVVVKGDGGGGDYGEFEDGYDDEKKSIQEENFMLRSNFSDDPLDQWDIVSFFDANERFKKFKPILLLQMQIQNSANYNNNDSNNPQQQLDDLLDTMLGNNNRNDSSSDSDDDMYNGEQDSNTFRDYINMGYMPSPTSLIYDIVLNEYDFNLNENCRKEETDEKALFYPSINYAKTNYNDNIEHFVSISLNNNINKDDFQRYKLNLVIVLETSSSMKDAFKSGADDKIAVSKNIISTILKQLNSTDRFCLVTFDDTFDVKQPLTEISNIEMDDFKENLNKIDAKGGGCDFDEGYNAALGQLQELFDVEVMSAAKDDDDDDDNKNDDLYENRLIMITDNLPNPDSSLIDLMQVYSDNDENKVYTSFINVNDMAPSPKLMSDINKMRGCNMSYLNVISSNDAIKQIDDQFEYIVNPIFFNVSLKVNDIQNDTVYGFNNNMKKMNKFSVNGQIKTINSLFLSEDFVNKSKDAVTARLQSPDNDDDDIEFEVELSYEHRDGEIGENKRNVVLAANKTNGIFDKENNSYFDNNAMRKRILIIKFVELLNEWVARDTQNEKMHLNVSNSWKTKFENFLVEYKYQSKQINDTNDENMKQDIELINKLINFDAKEAEMLRKLATFDK